MSNAELLIFQGRGRDRDAALAAWLAALRKEYGERVVEVARGLVRILPPRD